MTESESERYIGRRGRLSVEGLKFPVIITDAKRAYGVLRYRVSPEDNGKADVRANGQQWVNASRVTLE